MNPQCAEMPHIDRIECKLRMIEIYLWSSMMHNRPDKLGKITMNRAWNIRTLQDKSDSNRPERRTVLVCNELARGSLEQD
ncbi:Hypothetical predicted protein [Octopus vulgaris]|uniref:Uncharacterized protein n=1 Tax=Octopus vulgaris TaxID=6645 RepID=A0AA36EX92_OCTVU|nr:Hypothetical predicted protein [Octopus vulgaris]